MLRLAAPGAGAAKGGRAKRRAAGRQPMPAASTIAEYVLVKCGCHGHDVVEPRDVALHLLREVAVQGLQLKNGMATTRLARTSVHSNEALVTATSLRLDIICAYLGWFCGRSYDAPRLS